MLQNLTARSKNQDNFSKPYYQVSIHSPFSYSILLKSISVITLSTIWHWTQRRNVRKSEHFKWYCEKSLRVFITELNWINWFCFSEFSQCTKLHTFNSKHHQIHILNVNKNVDIVRSAMFFFILYFPSLKHKS